MNSHSLFLTLKVSLVLALFLFLDQVLDKIFSIGEAESWFVEYVVLWLPPQRCVTHVAEPAC
jgi:hypothetical protein